MPVPRHHDDAEEAQGLEKKARDCGHVSVVTATIARQAWHWTLTTVRLKEGEAALPNSTPMLKTKPWMDKDILRKNGFEKAVSPTGCGTKTLPYRYKMSKDRETCQAGIRKLLSFQFHIFDLSIFHSLGIVCLNVTHDKAY